MADAPLWTPDPASLAGLPITAFRAEAARRAGRPLRRSRRAARLVGRGSRRLLGSRLGFLRRHRREGRAPARRGRRHARGALLPGCAAELCREPPEGARSRHGARLPRRGQGRAAAELGRAPRARLAPAAGDARGGHRRRRPRRGDAAEPAGDDRRHARHRLARRDLVVLLAGFRRARRARPFRPDRPEALRRLRRLLVRRQGDRRWPTSSQASRRSCRARRRS